MNWSLYRKARSAQRRQFPRSMLTQILGPNDLPALKHALPVSRIQTVGIALLIAALGIAACAGQSDEERCKTGGGVWKQDSCENSSR